MNNKVSDVVRTSKYVTVDHDNFDRNISILSEGIKKYHEGKYKQEDMIYLITYVFNQLQDYDIEPINKQKVHTK